MQSFIFVVPIYYYDVIFDQRVDNWLPGFGDFADSLNVCFVNINMIAYPDIDLFDPIFDCDLRELQLVVRKWLIAFRWQFEFEYNEHTILDSEIWICINLIYFSLLRRVILQLHHEVQHICHYWN